MKANAPIFIIALAFGLTQNLLAQDDNPVGFDFGLGGGGGAPAGADEQSSPRVSEIRLEAGQLPIVVQIFTKEFESAGDQATDPGQFQVPTIIWGPGAPERVIEAPLRLVNVGAPDGLALIATAAGCALEPINSPPQNGEHGQPRIIGYRIVSLTNGDFTPAAAAGVATPIAVAQVTAPTLPDLEVVAEDALSFTPDGNFIFIDKAADAIHAEPEQLVGIGVTLHEDDGKILIRSILPNSPAARNGAVKPGMQLLGVAPKGGDADSIEGKNLAEVVGMMRGNEDTTVSLKLLGFDDSGEPISVSLGREVLPLPQPEYRVVTPPRVTVVDPHEGVVLNLGREGEVKAGATLFSRPTTETAVSPKFVRVYALGAILRGGEEELERAEQTLTELIEITLNLAELQGKDEPTISIHGNSKTLIVKATNAEHEIISQVIEAWKENKEAGETDDQFAPLRGLESAEEADSDGTGLVPNN